MHNWDIFCLCDFWIRLQLWNILGEWSKHKMVPKFPCIQYTCTERNVNKTYLFQQWLEVSLRIEWGQWPPLSCLGLPVFWEDQGTWHWDWIRQVRNIQKLYIYPNVFRYRGFQKIIRYKKNIQIHVRYQDKYLRFATFTFCVTISPAKSMYDTPGLP